VSLRTTLDDASKALQRAGVPSPQHDATALLAHVLGVKATQLPLHPVDDMSAEQAERYADLVRRRAAREPLQHLTGRAAFRHVELSVGPGVFVPRPETEVLAGWAAGQAAQLSSARVVDLGTGSGAIALAVASEAPGSEVHAVELDEDAFAWAERNLAGSGVDLRQGDMADAFTDLDGSVDVVVSNPPYIPMTAYESVAPEARDHDPDLALWSGGDGLDAVRVVERVAARLLRVGGVVGVEHAEVQADAVPRVFRSAGRWAEVEDHRDLAGRPRFTTARLADFRE
jgi:release factor glutamine methyltransferase